MDRTEDHKQAIAVALEGLRQAKAMSWGSPYATFLYGTRVQRWMAIVASALDGDFDTIDYLNHPKALHEFRGHETRDEALLRLWREVQEVAG